MASPEFLPTGEGYVYRWGTEDEPALVTIHVTEVRRRNSSLHCVLTTYTTLPGARHMPDHWVLSSEVWLRNERDRLNYAASLSRLMPPPAGATPIDYGAMLEEVARLVIEHETVGFDIQRLNGNVTQQPTTYLWQGVVPDLLPTTLYGAGGVGKSILAAAIAVAIQHGVPLLGLPTRRAEVLYLDWETDANDVGRRMHASAKGLGVENPTMRYASLSHPLEDKVSELSRVVAQDGIGLVIIDSAGMAIAPGRSGGDANETALRFYSALRRMGCAALVIDHVSGDDLRRGSKGAAKPYGSVYKMNVVRNAFELRQAREPDEHGIHLLLKHRKTNIGPRLSDTAVRLIWDDGHGVVTLGIDTSPAVAAPVAPLPAQIMDILGPGGATARQITDMLAEENLNYNEMDVRRAITRLMMVGKVHAASDGTISLATSTPDAVDSTLL